MEAGPTGGHRDVVGGATCGVTFVDRLGEHGAAIALVVGEREISYRELDELVTARAVEFGAVRRLVAIAMTTELEPVVAYLAALRARCPVLVIDGGDAAQLASIVVAYDPDVVVSRATRGWTLVEVRPGSTHRLHPELASLLSTSGSTSSPKLVRLTAANLSANADSIVDYLGIGPDDCAITTLPLYYCYGLSVLHSHLLAGARLVLTGDSVLDPSFWTAVDRWGVTSFAGVPHTFELLDRVDFASRPHPTLRTITQAGGRLPPERVRAFAELARRDGWRLFVMYGQTEATARMAYVPADQILGNPSVIGVAIPGGRLRVEPVDGAPAGSGELVYTGPNVMLGYATSPADLALGRVVHDLRTGDLGHQLPNGMFEIVGRASRFVKLFGRRVDLEQAERDLDARGIDARCAGNDDQLVVVVRDRVHVETARQYALDDIGLVPAVVTVCVREEFPRLPNGKIDYESITRAGATEARAAPTRSTRMRWLFHRPAQTVMEGYALVFGRDDLCDTDTFISLGGDSMSYIEASIHVEQALGHLPDQWHTTSIADLQRAQRAPSLWRSLETNVVVRAAAIMIVVGTHFNVFFLQGGAHALLAVAGFNFSRFQLASIRETDRSTGILASAARIAIPTLVWSCFLLVVDDTFYPVSFLLVTNFIAQPAQGFRTDYWFIEVLLQILLITFVAFSFPAVRRFQRRRPIHIAAVALGIGLLARYGLGAIWDPTYKGLPKTTHIVLWLFTLGWAVEAVGKDVRARLVLSAVSVVAVVGFFDYPRREAITAIGLLALIWIPKVPVPWPLNRVIALIANATMYIYLIHVTVADSIGFRSPVEAWILMVALGIATGLVAERVMRASEAWLRRTLRARRGTTPVGALIR